MSLKTKSQWMKTQRAVDSFIKAAEDCCTGVTPEHYRKFTDWYFEKPREIALNYMTFVLYLTRSVYSADQLNEIRQDKTLEKIQVLPVERWVSKS
ncbi:hypothetical protein [Lactococcus garvieae]|uniref:Uncharacterized protein n=1 Tax=Lactococcus garvieae DCC43 TaxID=1231377 RepID=K2PGZ6_9LACT|nr:hypothetical protein [Lactococcus garvieae]EKF50675.1 hypothetical protein C426_1965 [Lactococcus garvieae DCC43]